MAEKRFPITPAIRALKQKGVEFTLLPYNYEEKGGTKTAAAALNVDEHLVIKTLVMQEEKAAPFLVLMHGDRKVSTKELARALGAKTVTPSDPGTAGRYTGYMVGGISPFGTRKPLRVYVEESILSCPKIYINAGKRGLLAELRTKDLVRILQPISVNVGI